MLCCIQVEVLVREEGDTRSGKHLSTSAQHERMRVNSSQGWKREWEGHVKEHHRRKSEKCHTASVVSKCII